MSNHHVFRLEPPSGIIQSVTELIPETYSTKRETQNVDKDSNSESSNLRNATEGDRENQKVCTGILGIIIGGFTG